MLYSKYLITKIQIRETAEDNLTIWGLEES